MAETSLQNGIELNMYTYLKYEFIFRHIWHLQGIGCTKVKDKWKHQGISEAQINGEMGRAREKREEKIEQGCLQANN